MLTWISRILIFVFMFNILSPEFLWAQQRPSNNSTQDISNDVRQSLQEQLTTATHHPLQQNALIFVPILGSMLMSGKIFAWALNKRLLAQDQALFDHNVNMHLEALAHLRQTYQRRMAQDQGHLFTPEYEAILREIDKAEAALNKIANSKDKLADKFTQFVTWAELPDLHKAENTLYLKVIDANITNIETDIFMVGDDLSKEQRYRINRLLEQAKRKRAAKDITGALQAIESIHKTWTGEQAAPALTLKQERVLAKDDALAIVALMEEIYSSMPGLTPKEQRQLTKQIKDLAKKAKKEILQVSKQKELTLPELQARYEEITVDLLTQIEILFEPYQN